MIAPRIRSSLLLPEHAAAAPSCAFASYTLGWNSQAKLEVSIGRD